MKQKNVDDDGSVTATGTLDDNRDPISDAPGAHPVGVGVGAAGGAATGAAVGSVAGPVGTLVGGAVGAVVGGLAGKGVAEAVNPTVEDAYWRDNYKTRPYIDQGAQYDAYQPAYRYGWESYGRHEGRTFDEVESELGRDWEARADRGRLSWDKARHAVRDAWERIEHGVVNKR
jgi:phage tail tape-measure protein